MAFDSAALTTIAEVSYGNRLVVPEFQRGYAWVEDQWRSLWDDALNLVRRGHPQHYAGAIMISRSETDPGVSELIDGQQRLTSISLMLRALEGKGFPVEFRQNEALQTYFDYYAMGREHMGPSLEQHRSFYARNLQRAAEYFAQRASEISAEDRKGLADALLQRFKLFVLVIQPEFDVHVAFETINNRGKPLSTLEKLKNRLIYLATNASDRDAGRAAAAEVHRCWKGIYTWLGKGAALLSDEDFLRAHSFGWFRHERRAEWLSTQLFDEEFSSYKEVAPEDIAKYVRSLENAAVCWYYLNEPRSLPPEIAQRLVALERTPASTSRPLLLWALVRISSAFPRLTMDPSSDTSWCDVFEKLAFEVERLAVLVVLANDKQSNVGQADINRSAYALAHPGQPPYEQLPSLVPPESALQAVGFARDHMHALTNNFDPETEEYVDQRFQWSGYFTAERLRDVVTDRIRKGDGFYNWQFGKLLIYQWEEWLRGGRGLPERKPWEKFGWDDSVEHIYPQSPHRGWIQHVPLDGRSSDALRKAITNSLGNLMLLSRSRNSSLSNIPYCAFEDVGGKAQRYRTGSYSEMQVALLCDRWTVVQIAARGIAMMRLAQRVWDFELVAHDAKLTEWLPVLFGDMAARVQSGTASARRVDGRSLQQWVERFETGLPR
ncbi:hypothetical protein D9M68_210030 [compost metagenome]